MNVLGLLRADEIDLPLMIHVLGAVVLVGGVALAALSFATGRGTSPVLTRLGFRALLTAALPGYVLMRGAAQWVEDKEGLADADPPPAWIDIGYITAEPGLLLLIIATVVAWRATKRTDAGETPGAAMRRVPLVLSSLLVLMFLVAVWAMTTKPV